MTTGNQLSQTVPSPAPSGPAPRPAAAKRRLPLVAALLLPLLLVACALTVPFTHGTDLLRSRGESVVTTTGMWASMIYLARTDSGVVVVDLGWTRAERALERGLARLGATPADVRLVFITHSHRDHVGAWRALRGATFVLAAAETAQFTGARPHRGAATRLVDRLLPPPLPRPGELQFRTFTRDTVFVVGRDTVRAYLVPGHTAGSAAYLIRGRLFMGDALNMRPFTGFRGARPVYSDDVQRSRASVAALWDRLPPETTRVVCTAHAKCARDGAALREQALRP
jgi:glyoxylase-like metal-dependent hydrolase (beta-lactamase superfamily II)